MTSVLLHTAGRGELDPGDKIRAMGLTPAEIGARIVTAREEKEPKPWSQFDLAIALGVSPSTVYRWEKGKLPSVNELVRLAELLDKPTDYFTEPPERRTELSELASELAIVRLHLEELRAEADSARWAFAESLEQIRQSLVRLEASIPASAEQGRVARDGSAA